MVVVGITGPIAAGKGEICSYLSERYSASTHRFSDVLSDVLVRLHRPIVRKDLQGLGAALRGAFGDDVLVKALKEDVAKDDAPVVIVDGVRYKSEADMVKEVGGFLIFVTAPQNLRWKRASSRGSRGEASISFDDFKASERRETELGIAGLESVADAVIVNDGSLDDLKGKVDGVLKRFTRSC
ncbi:Dephospho-CoA kinase [uncultured archaeon]|nr:Dephospho-CoA kinase [uncultured archaeon]